MKPQKSRPLGRKMAVLCFGAAQPATGTAYHFGSASRNFTIPSTDCFRDLAAASGTTAPDFTAIRGTTNASGTHSHVRLHA